MITTFKNKIVSKALRIGICENFGQDEIRKLKDKYGYNHYGTEKEKLIAKDIDYLDNWVSLFDFETLRLYNEK